MVGLLVMIVIFLCSMCYSFCWFWCNKRYRKKNMAKESAKVAKNAASSEGGITLENMTEKFQAKGSGQNPFYSVDMHCREEERQESMELRLVWLPTGKRHQQRQKRGNTMNHHETYTRNFADWLELVSYDVNNAIFLSGTNSLKKTEPLKNSTELQGRLSHLFSLFISLLVTRTQQLCCKYLVKIKILIVLFNLFEWHFSEFERKWEIKEWIYVYRSNKKALQREAQNKPDRS